MKRYVVVEASEDRVTSDPFTVFMLPIMRLAVYGSRRMVQSIPDWPYRYVIREVPGTTSQVKVYRDIDDWWIGYYRGPNHHYVCPFFTIVIRWPRR